MATNTAPGGSVHGTVVRSADPPTRPLWQAPVFVLGVAALVGMAIVRPFAPVGPEQQLARKLDGAREILSHSDGDAQRALTLAQAALEVTSDYPERTAEAAFLVGTAHVRLAEQATPSHVAEAWQHARQFLEQAQHEQAEKASLSNEDQDRLGYLLGKVGFYTGDKIESVIERLEEGTKRSDNPAEGWSLLTQACLRQQPPNLAKALECNRKLREVTRNDAELAAAKVQGGEILLRMNKPAEARGSLGDIPDRGPSELRARARLLRARSYQDEKQWSEAIRDYQTTLADSRATVPDAAGVYYNLGLCYREREQPKEAASAWQECVKLARGNEGPAAALVLAEVRLLEAAGETEAPAKLAAHENALKALNIAVAKVRSPAHWSNPLIGKPRALQVFEKAAESFRRASHYDLATQMIEPYSRLAPPLAVLSLRGQVASEWAGAKLVDARASKTIEGRAELEKDARALYARAAEAFAEAASQPALSPPEQSKHLWDSVVAYQSAKDPVKVMERLEKIVKLEQDKEKLGEAYYHLGEIHHQGKDSRTAEANYRLCIQQGETYKYAYYAHYQLAVIARDEGRTDEALQELTNNLNHLRFESDPVALADSLFALVDILYQRKDYRGVRKYLEGSLVRFKEDPAFKDNAEVTRARYQLADSYRQIAAMDLQHFLTETATMSAEARAHYQQEYRRRLLEAAEEFSSLDAFLSSDAGKEHLPQQRIQVPFITAKCWFNLGEGEYDKALAIYLRLIARYPEQLEGLEALGGAVQCFAAKGQLADVQQRLVQIRQLLPKMPPEIRKAWEEWVDKATRELANLPANAEG